MDGAEGARRKRPLRAASATPTDEAYAVHHRTGLELPTLASDHGGASLGREDLLKDGTGCACVWPAAEVEAEAGAEEIGCVRLSPRAEGADAAAGGAQA